MYQLHSLFFLKWHTLIFTSQEFLQETPIKSMFKENRKRFRVVYSLVNTEYTLRIGISSVKEMLHYFEFSYYRPKNERFPGLGVLPNSLSWDLS